MEGQRKQFAGGGIEGEAGSRKKISAGGRVEVMKWDGRRCRLRNTLCGRLVGFEGRFFLGFCEFYFQGNPDTADDGSSSDLRWRGQKRTFPDIGIARFLPDGSK